jgi:hypothetical protein
MGRSVTITTPIPTLEEVGKRLKMSKARQRRLIEIVRGSAPVQFSVRRRAEARLANARLRHLNGCKKPSTVGIATKPSTQKKSKSAAAR